MEKLHHRIKIRIKLSGIKKGYIMMSKFDFKLFLSCEIGMILFALFWMFINNVRIELFPMYLIGGTFAVVLSMFLGEIIAKVMNEI